MLLLHLIYGGAQELSTSQAAKDLELTPTSISRASRQLEEMGLLHIRKVGVQRIMQSEDSPKTLFQKAGDKLLNPIKRTVYIPKKYVGTDLLESGYSALAKYSMLNAPNVGCYAAERTKNIENRNQVEFVSLEQMVPQDHLLRQIDAAIDFNKVYEFVEDLYCRDNGRPSIDPVVLFKIVLIQHIYGIRSLR